MLRMPENRSDRVLSAQWGGKKNATLAWILKCWPTTGRVCARHQRAFCEEKINVTGVNTLSKQNQANMQFSMK